MKHVEDVRLIGSGRDEDGLALGIAVEQLVEGVGDLRGDLAVALAEQVTKRVGIRSRAEQRRQVDTAGEAAATVQPVVLLVAADGIERAPARGE